MLATRSLRFAAVRYAKPTICVRSPNYKNLVLQPNVANWTTRPLAAAYSKDIKSGGSLAEAGVKLPNKDQVERFFFKSLVYLWDFSYYVFCLCVKLVETYIFNNSTVQHYWKQLLKRMDDARREIK